jgi:hypothetical protein
MPHPIRSSWRHPIRERSGTGRQEAVYLEPTKETSRFRTLFFASTICMYYYTLHAHQNVYTLTDYYKITTTYLAFRCLLLASSCRLSYTTTMRRQSYFVSCTPLRCPFLPLRLALRRRLSLRWFFSINSKLPTHFLSYASFCTRTCVVLLLSNLSFCLTSHLTSILLSSCPLIIIDFLLPLIFCFLTF